MFTLHEIAKMIDHSILHPTFTDEDLKTQCMIARKFDVAAACVKPFHTALAAELLKDSDVKICSVIGFPHGNSSTEVKAFETEQVIKDGATEVDMVINIGKALQNDWRYIAEELNTLNRICVSNSAILKVIFETDYLTKNEDKIRLCELCNEAGVAFVKTSTGYGFVKLQDGNYNYHGATDHDLLLMRKHCESDIQIKAAGGIRTLEDILRVRKIGVTRVGATATENIIKAAAEFLKKSSI